LLRAQAVEERNHAMIIVQYLLAARTPITVPGVGAPRTEFGDPIEPVRLALAQEEGVTDQIQELAKLARARATSSVSSSWLGSSRSSPRR